MTMRQRRSRLPYAIAAFTALGVMLGTWVLGWWSVPIVALIIGAIWFDHPRVASLTAAGAAIGWLLLLIVDGLHGRLFAMGSALGGVFHLPGILLLLVTLAFAAALAWATAAIAQAVTALVTRR